MLQPYGWNNAKPRHSTSYLAPSILKILKPHLGRSILDIGCGNGSLTSRLSKQGHNIVGIDGDEAGISFAKVAYPSIKFSCISIYDSPFLVKQQVGLFDCIVSTEVVEHLYDPYALISLSSILLKPGGLLILSTPYHGYFKNFLISLLGGWDKHFTSLWTGGHIKFWSSKSIRELLHSCGFTVSKITTVGRIYPLSKSMIVLSNSPFS